PSSSPWIIKPTSPERECLELSQDDPAQPSYRLARPCTHSPTGALVRSPVARSQSTPGTPLLTRPPPHPAIRAPPSPLLLFAPASPPPTPNTPPPPPPPLSRHVLRYRHLHQARYPSLALATAAA